MTYVLSVVISSLFSYHFLPPDDPNFLSSIGSCIVDPNCREELIEYLRLEDFLNRLENDPNSIVYPTFWRRIHEVKRQRLQAMFEHWLYRDKIRKGFQQPIPFDPNEVRVEVYGLNRALNVETECFMRWWFDGNTYWVDKYYKIYDSSDLNKDGIVNMEDFNLLLKGR
jgi:hypothetical protein